MDVRSAGNQKCASQLVSTWGDCAALQREPLRKFVVTAARRTAHGPAGCRMVAYLKACRQSSGQETAAAVSRREENRSPCANLRVEGFTRRAVQSSRGAKTQPAGFSLGILSGHGRVSL